MDRNILLQISILIIIILFLLLYHLCCFPSCPPSFLLPFLLLVILVLILSSSSSSQLALFTLPPIFASIAAAAVPLEAAQEVGPEAAEGADVASGPVGRGHVLLQPAGQEEGELAVFTAVWTLHIVAALHVGDGEACEDMHGDK